MIRSRSSRCVADCVAALALTIGCAVGSASSQAQAQPGAIDPANPFAPLVSVPDVVDAAAVFNNPAEHLLLSDSGRTIRKLLALGGVFTHTEHAWQALAQTLGAGTDETIRDLLGKRVLVVWDGIGADDAQHNARGLVVGGLANSIDTRWMLMCDVDRAYLQQLRARLRPVKRDIVHGRAVYAIEKGRYTLALLSADEGDGVARVLLAPRDGAALFTQVLGAMVGAHPRTPADRSILHGSETLLARLPQTHAGSDGTPWGVAWLLRLDRLRPSAQDVDDNADRPRTLAGVMGLDAQGMRLSFAADLRVDESFADAPTDLLDAVGPDQVVALASARSMRMLLRSDAMQLGFDIASAQARPPAPDDVFSGPGVMVMSRLSPDPAFLGEPGANASETGAAGTGSGDMALTLIVEHHREQQEASPDPFARWVDDGVRSMIQGLDPQQAPDHQGRFPSAIRTHTLRLPAADASRSGDQPAAGPASWPGPSPRLSWVGARRGDDDLLIASFSTRQADTAAQVRTMRQLAASLDALGASGGRTGEDVLMRGYLRPAQAIELLGAASAVDLAISRLVDRVSCDIRRGSDGVWGSVSVELRSAAGANLGAPLKGK